ncbi:MAG: response regulator [Desulfobacteraceae bacterium]|jgi:PAS domain S-box-containing protein
MAESTKIILVDDEPDILELLYGVLKGEGYAVRCAQSGVQAIELFKRESADVVVTDIRMPGMDGLEVLRTVKAMDNTVEVIVLTGYASIELAVSSLKNEGAFDFLTKPVERLEDFIHTIEKAVARRNLILEKALLLEELSRQQIHLEAYNKELRQTKRELEVSRYRYQDLYDQAPVGYLTINADWQIVEVNQAAARLFGMPKADIQHQSMLEFIVPEDRERYKLNHIDALDSHPYASEVRMIGSDGHHFYAHWQSLAILKEDGAIDQVRITIFDINAQKQTQLALEESEQRYRTFVENFKGIAFRLDSDGSPVFYHGAVEETTGYSESELVRNRPGWEILIHPEDLKQVRSRRGSLASCGDSNIAHEYRIRHRDRRWRWVREHIQSLGDPQGQGHILHGVIFDITDHKNLQAQYMESRKLDAIATMAGGIAHQFNNSLAGLLGNVELLEMDIEPGNVATQYIDPMMNTIQRMSQLTSQLLAYARGGKYLASKISTHDLVRQSIQLIEHRLTENIELKVELSADEDQIIADSTQLQMVILAVIENAIEAMNQRGAIVIQSRIVEMEKETVNGGGTHAPGRYLRLSIKDSGCGMPKKTADKIFDPFFTTKFIGRGLGLSAAYGIVLNHSGWMEVDTRVQEGTQMLIYLPLVDRPVAEAKEPDLPSPSKGHATILVVEDEEMVMKTVHELLERLDYRVLKALTGHKALELIKSHNSRIDVVLLDVKLPDVEAMDLYEQMLYIQPDLKVIVCSGYDQQGPVEKLLASGAAAFLQKPYSVSHLSSELKALIEQDTENTKEMEKIP